MQRQKSEVKQILFFQRCSAFIAVADVWGFCRRKASRLFGNHVSKQELHYKFLHLKTLPNIQCSHFKKILMKLWPDFQRKYIIYEQFQKHRKFIYIFFPQKIVSFLIFYLLPAKSARSPSLKDLKLFCLPVPPPMTCIKLPWVIPHNVHSRQKSLWLQWAGCYECASLLVTIAAAHCREAATEHSISPSE